MQIIHPPPSPCVWIILTKTRSITNHYQLVNIRWPELIEADVCYSDCTQLLLHDTISVLPNSSMDVLKVSGSNGLTIYSNHNILKVLTSKSAFIRKGRRVKLVKTHTKWYCFYLAAGGQGKVEHVNDRNIASCKYPQAQLGGHFGLTLEYFNKYFGIVKNMTGKNTIVLYY